MTSQPECKEGLKRVIQTIKVIYSKKTLRVCFIIPIFCLAVFVGTGKAGSEDKVYTGKSAKYVFLFIGDGMGIPQRNAAESFLSSGSNGIKSLLMNRLPAQGVTTTYAKDSYITGSAAAATAIASGKKTKIGYIGLDSEMKPVETITDIAIEHGMKAGIITSVAINHATPAAFYAHQVNRKMYYEIGIELVNSGIDFFGGGGIKNHDGNGPGIADIDLFHAAAENGYVIVDNEEDFYELDRSADKVIAFNHRLKDAKSLPYHIDNRGGDLNIGQFTKKAIELLFGDDGFFIMVEGGKIDWASHANDAVTVINEVIALDEAIKEAYKFYLKHPDETLIVITADHECGGLSKKFSGFVNRYDYNVLKGQNISFNIYNKEIFEVDLKRNRDSFTFESALSKVEEYFGLTVEGHGPGVLTPYELKKLKKEFHRAVSGFKVDKGKRSKDFLLYGGYNPFTVTLMHTLNQKAGFTWTSFAHTGAPVMTSAVGVGAESFNGFYDNTDIAIKIKSVIKPGHKLADL